MISISSSLMRISEFLNRESSSSSTGDFPWTCNYPSMAVCTCGYVSSCSTFLCRLSKFSLVACDLLTALLASLNSFSARLNFCIDFKFASNPSISSKLRSFFKSRHVFNLVLASTIITFSFSTSYFPAAFTDFIFNPYSSLWYPIVHQSVVR